MTGSRSPPPPKKKNERGPQRVRAAAAAYEECGAIGTDNREDDWGPFSPPLVLLNWRCSKPCAVRGRSIVAGPVAPFHF
ncbi:hypothetical protein NDU88_003828 [Pleurodeles waltl]|uniref:Uncharacterized protein n=1 Tax=Pleurodeles waltl TaxID=8319 RepID=A0AAV7LI60_PLEWA|nr:hypothetical protein NDU88_003828 [Pleurodeles waltl]